MMMAEIISVSQGLPSMIRKYIVLTILQSSRFYRGG